MLDPADAKNNSGRTNRASVVEQLHLLDRLSLGEQR